MVQNDKILLYRQSTMHKLAFPRAFANDTDEGALDVSIIIHFGYF